MSEPVSRSSYLIAGAIVVGCSAIALALYSRPVINPAPLSSTVSEPPRTASPPAVVPSPPAAVATSAASASPLPASEAHTPGQFLTIWRTIAAKAAAQCRPGEHLSTGPDSRMVELEMTLSVDADGRVREAKPTGELRDVANDGTYRKPKVDGRQQVSDCYAKQIKELVRFPAATAASDVTVQVRLLSQAGF